MVSQINVNYGCMFPGFITYEPFLQAAAHINGNCEPSLDQFSSDWRTGRHYVEADLFMQPAQRSIA